MITLICISTIVATACGFLSPLWVSTCTYGTYTVGSACGAFNWLYGTVSQIAPGLAGTIASVLGELGITCPAVGGAPIGPEIYEYPPGTFV